MKLKTLKDMKGGDENPRFISKTELREEAIEWLKVIDCEYEHHFGKTYKEHMKKTTNGMIPSLVHTYDFIVRFFDITEEELEDENI